MKIKNLLFASFAVVALVACSKNAADVEDTTPKTVTLTIDQSGPITAVTNDTPTTDGEKSTITDLNVFFLSNGDGVTNQFYLTAASTTPSIASLATGGSFAGVSGAATKIYVVANYGSDLTGLATLTAIKAKLAYLKAATAPSLNSTVDGYKTTVMTSGATVGTINPTTHVASLTIAPIISRIQIKKISTDATISAFTLGGIYINGTYAQVDITGAANGTIINYTNTQTASFTAANFGNLSVEGASLAQPTTGKCYAFNVSAGTLPHIVLKITSATVPGSTLTFPQYVTVSGYKKSGVDVTTFLAANVYNIDDLKFSASNLTTDPETPAAAVNVTVTVSAWTVHNVDPQIN